MPQPCTQKISRNSNRRSFDQEHELLERDGHIFGKSNEIYMMRRPGYQEYTAMMMMMFRFSYSAIYTQTHDSPPSGILVVPNAARVRTERVKRMCVCLSCALIFHFVVCVSAIVVVCLSRFISTFLQKPTASRFNQRMPPKKKV